MDFFNLFFVRKNTTQEWLTVGTTSAAWTSAPTNPRHLKYSSPEHQTALLRVTQHHDTTHLNRAAKSTLGVRALRLKMGSIILSGAEVVPVLRVPSAARAVV